MSDHRHAYIRQHGRGGNEYRIISLPVALLPDDLPSGYERIPRREAIRAARWTWDHGPAYVTVTPCACGTCGLSGTADAHPHSALATRIQNRRIEARQGPRDVLGRLQADYWTGEYTGDLPRWDSERREGVPAWA